MPKPRLIGGCLTTSAHRIGGLTATPERGDGVDVRDFFGGRVAAELRLWEALEQHLLCPFHYFGIHDGTDLGTCNGGVAATIWQL